MNILLSVFLVLQLYGTISSQNMIFSENDIIAKNNVNVKQNYLDVLMEDLLKQSWEKEESTCLNKFLDVMNNVKNSTLWAVWVWDSMQTPAGLLYGSQYSLGNYDQCMYSPWMETHPEFRTQYCMADIKLSDTDPNNKIGDLYRSVKYHIRTMTKHWLRFNRITWGVCIPSGCKTKSTRKFVRSMLKFTHLGSEIDRIDVHHCQVTGETAEFSWGMYFLGIIIVSVVIITLLCTIINGTKTSNNTHDNKLLQAFCLTTNSSSLKKISKNDINVLHGLRALTSLGVICLHVVFLSHSIGYGNPLTLNKDMDRLKIKALLRADYTVDIFLLMSGLLRIKSYIAIGNINPLKAILKRYLRYVFTIGLMILCITEVSKHVGDGPIWNLLSDEESRACKKNWLISLLMLGNYVDNKNICYPVLWTVPCDFHWSVIATILYWLFKKNKMAAITIYGILMTGALILPGMVTYQQNLQKIFAFDFSTYMMSHLRGGPYLIGMALGYLMSTYKPNRYILSKLISSVGIIFALTILAINIYVAGFVQDNPNSNEFSFLVFSSIHRSIFALAICCIIMICEYGNVRSKLLKAFCLTTNVSSLNKLSKNDIKVLHGIKALASFLVIFIHVAFLQQSIGFSNSLTLDKDINGLQIESLRQADYTVDIFLMISGLLRIKSYITIGNIIPFKALLKRYLRYIITVGVIILSIIVTPIYIGDGPIWNLIAGEETKCCKKNWLISLLMLGNYVDKENICYLILWTVPCDFQLSVIATTLYWLFQKNKKAAIIIYGILTTTALILPGVLNYQQNLPKTVPFDFRSNGNYKKKLPSTYILSHHRAAPYFIGMALGFFMSTYNPNKHRNMFSKLTSSIGTIFALTIAAINVMGRLALDKPNTDELFPFIISSLHRSIFTLAICCIIIACEYGNVPLLGSVLTWPAFIPISKISFGIYLVHCLIYSRMISTTRSPLHYNAFLLIIYPVALISISCIAGMLMYLFVEAPTIRITDMINIKADTEKKETNKTTSENKNGVPHSNGIKKYM